MDMTGDATWIAAPVIKGLRAVLLPRLRLFFLNEKPWGSISVPLDVVCDSELEMSEDMHGTERWREEVESGRILPVVPRGGECNR